MTLNQMLLDKWYSNNCKLSFLEMLFDEISFLRIHVYCFELVITYETLELKEKNGCIHPQQDSYELSFRCILRYCPHPPLVFPLIICIYDSLYLAISCNYKCFSSLWFSVDKFICGMKLKIIFFCPWKCKVIFPEYWLSSPLSDGKVQVVCKNRERSFMGF